MLWSLVAGRITLGAVASLAARTAHQPTFSVVTRRTLFATPQPNSPPAEASEDAGKKTTRKTAEAKGSKTERATPAKRGRPPKNPAEHQEKQPKQERSTHIFRDVWRNSSSSSPHTEKPQAPQACTWPLLPFLFLLYQISAQGEYATGVSRAFQACW